MKQMHILSLALVGQLGAIPALAQGSGKDVTIFRMGGPQLGVRLEEVDQDVVSRLKLKEEKGALVTSVLENSAAEKAGIKKDDVIVKFQGEAILTASQLGRLVREVPAGRKVDLDVIRAGAPLKVTATLERAEWSDEKFGKLDMKEMKDFPKAFNFKLDEGGPGWMPFARAGRGRLGITYTEIEGQLAAYFKAPKDTAILVNSVSQGSSAEKAGLKAGDLLVRIGSAAIENGEELSEAVGDLDTGKATPVTVWRDGRNVDLTLTIEEPKRAETRRRRPLS